MTATDQNFTTWSGDDKVLTVTVTDGSGTATNLTGATINYELQALPPDGVALLTKTTGGGGISITDAAAGTFEITIAAADTASLSGVYFHECQVVDSSGNVSTIFTGRVNIREDFV